MRTVFGVFLALSLLAPGALAPSDAEAQARNWDINTPHQGGRPFQLDFHGGFAWQGVGVATGVRFGIPLVDNGFISSLNNSVYLNFGVDFYWVRWRGGGRDGWDYNYGVGFPVTLHWEFHFNETWSAFAELGFQFYLHPDFFNGDGNFGVREPSQWFVAAVGGSWHISESFALTVRVGNPYVAFGLTLQFGG